MWKHDRGRGRIKGGRHGESSVHALLDEVRPDSNDGKRSRLEPIVRPVNSGNDLSASNKKARPDFDDGKRPCNGERDSYRGSDRR